MDPAQGEGKVKGEEGGGSVDGDRRASYPVDVSASRRNLLAEDGSRRRLSDSFTTLPGRMRFLQLGSASARFKRLAEERDLMSRAVGSSGGHRFRHRIGSRLGRKIDWANLVKLSKEWIRDPMNMALFLWIACVAVSGAILFLVMTGMLNRELPKKSQRDTWFEVNNQILNALFTLMCLYQHPKRFYHLVLLCRWRPEDIAKLRKVYCKNGTYKPHEWAHMMVVVVLLHINCFAQYALCGLNLGYKRSQRPAIGVAICISVAIGAPAFAGLYTIMSPLGRDYESGSDEESQVCVAGETVEIDRLRVKSFEKRLSFAVKEDRVVEVSPKWSGGIFDFWDDISLAYLSLFCSFCVFGWNMERLGFGNMYVHIATFILFCSSPFWILNLAAVNIGSETAREALSVTGIVLCLFGLLYGGFWRIQMRNRFNLPAYEFCCGKPSLSDCTLWLCCCWCSLAQEVRTVNSYDIVEEKFCLKQGNSLENEPGRLSPLPNEDRVFELRPSMKSPSNNSFANSPSPSRFYQSPDMKHGFASSPSPTRFYQSPEIKLPSVTEESTDLSNDEIMRPPSPIVIRKESL